MRLARIEHNGNPVYAIVEGDELALIEGDPVRRARDDGRARAAGRRDATLPRDAHEDRGDGRQLPQPR